MRVLPASDPASIAEAVKVLRAGGVVVHPTETCYGIACDISNPSAVRKVFQLKARLESQPVSALFPSVEDSKKYVVWNEKAEELSKQHLPGPFTMILMMREDGPKKLYPTPTASVGASVGVRVSSSEIATSLVTSFGGPISTTSANIHGQPNPYTSEQILASWPGGGNAPDLFLDGGTLPPVPPSTVVDLTKEIPETRRQGSARA